MGKEIEKGEVRERIREEESRNTDKKITLVVDDFDILLFKSNIILIILVLFYCWTNPLLLYSLVITHELLILGEQWRKNSIFSVSAV